LLPYPDIGPVAFHAGPVAVRWYALAYGTGMLAAWGMARAALPALARAGRPAPSPSDVADLALWGGVGAVLGGRLGYVLVYDPARYLADPWDVLAIRQGGMSFHGGLAGAALAAFLLARARRLPALSLMDVAALGAPVGLGLGRLANLANGELWGRVSPALPLGMVFPGAGPLPRHPSQLYEAVAEGLLLLCAVLAAALATRMRRPGLVAGTFALGYALARTACEQFREPDPQLGYLWGDADLGLTMGTVLCLPLAAAGAWLVARAFLRPPTGTGT